MPISMLPSLAARPESGDHLAQAGFWDHTRSSLFPKRVDFRITGFEACLAFTPVTACLLAASPYATLPIRGFDGFVAPSVAPIAAGWSDQLPGGSFTH